MRILISMVLISLMIHAPLAKANVLETTISTGIRILETGEVSGVGIPFRRNQVQDPRYPYWNEYCDSITPRPGDALCWPNNPKNFFSYPKSTTTLVIELYMSNGYGEVNKTIVDAGSHGLAYTTLHTYDTQSTRFYRMQFYSSVLSVDSTDCVGVVKKTTPMAVDNGSQEVYLVQATARASLCRIIVELEPSGIDTRVSVSLNAIQARYTDTIYTQVPSGDWDLLSYWPDKMTIKAYDGTTETVQHEIFNGVNIRFNLSLEGYFRYSLLSPSTQVISFNPSTDKLKAFVFNSLIETNARDYTLTILCENKVGDRCALKNNEQVLLPLNIAYRSDFLGGPTYKEFLTEGKVYHFEGDVTRNYPTGIAFLLLQDDVLRIERDNMLLSRQFEGSATIIFEALF